MYWSAGELHQVACNPSICFVFVPTREVATFPETMRSIEQKLVAYVYARVRPESIKLPAW